MSDIRLTFEKLEIPIIWLDTSIILKMTLWKNDKPLDSKTARRMEYLCKNIYQFVSEKKLICPRGDQGEEIWNKRAEFLETMLSLSLGIRSKHSEEIKEYQIYQFMKAYINDEKEVSINSEDFFNSHPLEQLRNVSEVVIEADLGLIETAENIRNRKTRQNVKIEEIRQQNVSAGVTYEDQLVNELNADLNSLSKKNGNLEQQSALGTYFRLFIGNQYISYWEQLEGEPEELPAFFKSSHYRSIPEIDISSKLFAKLITGTETIKSGHPMDVHYAASAIPYVNFFITDRNMKHIISKLGIDEYYQCKVCHSSDRDEIKKFFSDL